MDIQPLEIVIHIVNIAVLFLILRFLLYGPVSRFMRERSEGIEKQLDDAEKAQTEADGMKALYTGRLEQADREARERMRESAQEANRTAADIVASAKFQAEELLATAREKSRGEREEAVASLEKQITDMAVALAKRILQREISEADNQKVIDTFFNKAG